MLIGEGLNNQEIAGKFAKAGLKDRAQAVRYAYAKGMVRPRVE